MTIAVTESVKMDKKYIDAKEFWNRLISVSENDWVGFDTIDEVLSGMPDIDYEIINDAHNEGYDVGYWAGRRDYEPKWIPVTERLPEEEGLYLVTCFNERPRLEVAWFYIDEEGFGYFSCDWSDFDSVTAWMPAPEPYKGGEEE